MEILLLIICNFNIY